MPSDAQSTPSVPPSDEGRCPDFNPYCDGTEAQHGEWCANQAWAERMIARYDPKRAHPDFREAQELEDGVQK